MLRSFIFSDLSTNCLWHISHSLCNYKLDSWDTRLAKKISGICLSGQIFWRITTHFQFILSSMSSSSSFLNLNLSLLFPFLSSRFCLFDCFLFDSTFLRHLSWYGTLDHLSSDSGVLGCTHLCGVRVRRGIPRFSSILFLCCRCCYTGSFYFPV